MDQTKQSKLIVKLIKDIDDARVHADWVYVSNLAEQLRSKDAKKLKSLADFYQTESKLEAAFLSPYRSYTVAQQEKVRKCSSNVLVTWETQRYCSPLQSVLRASAGMILNITPENNSVITKITQDLKSCLNELPKSEPWTEDVKILCILLLVKAKFLLIKSTDEYKKLAEQLDTDVKIDDIVSKKTVSILGKGGRSASALDVKSNLASSTFPGASFSSSAGNYLPSQSSDIRLCRVLAEISGIKAICLERTLVATAVDKEAGPRVGSVGGSVEGEERLNSVYIQVADLSYIYLQSMALHKPIPNSLSAWKLHSKYIDIVLTTAVLRGCMLHERKSKPISSMSRYREILSFVQVPASQLIRIELAQSLADLLIRGVGGHHYITFQADKAAQKLINKLSLVKYKPVTYNSSNVVVPASAIDEALLLLFIADVCGYDASPTANTSSNVFMHTDEAVSLSRHHEEITSNLLTICLARFNLFSSLIPCMERAVRATSVNSLVLTFKRALCAHACNMNKQCEQLFKSLQKHLEQIEHDKQTGIYSPSQSRIDVGLDAVMRSTVRKQSIVPRSDKESVNSDQDIPELADECNDLDLIEIMLMRALNLIENHVDINAGIELAQAAVDRILFGASSEHTVSQNSVVKMKLLPLDSAVYVKAKTLQGIGWALKSYERHVQYQRRECDDKAMRCFLKAYSLDSKDYFVHFQLAIQYFRSRQLPSAYYHVKKALFYDPNFLHATHLFALILSARKQYSLALALLEEKSDGLLDVNIGITRIRLESLCRGIDVALDSCRKLFQRWKEIYENDSQRSSDPYASYRHSTAPLGAHNGVNYSDDFTADSGMASSVNGSNSGPAAFQNFAKSTDYGGNVLNLPGKGAMSSGVAPSVAGAQSLASSQHQMNDNFDGVSIPGESLAVSRVETVLSDQASTYGSFVPKHGSSGAGVTAQIAIIAEMATFYLKLGAIDDAWSIVAEGEKLRFGSHLLLHARGILFMESDLDAARQCFENALAVHPWFIPSLVKLGNVSMSLNHTQSAEKYFRDALHADPYSHEAWHGLGDLMQLDGNCPGVAAEYYKKAQTCLANEPVRDANVIPRTFCARFSIN